MHTMDYVNAAMTGTFLPHVLPIMDLKKMLVHIEETLPPTLHLPVSSEDTLHFYRMKQWQWRCHLNNSVLVRKPMDNFVISLPLFNHLQTHHPASQLYTPRMHVAFHQDVHYK